jgi:2-polyprenyl-3-methyl-5-hydroxy-6-metoxy-1,4-benzoquinol methylase
VLEALAAIGVVDRGAPTAEAAGGRRGPTGGDSGYRLSSLGRAHLVEQGPELERFGLQHQVNKLRGWLDLPEVIRTGQPSTRGVSRRDVRSRSRAMGERDPEVLTDIVARCLSYAGEIRTMIDVGGAVGHLARLFADRGVKATLLDKEDVIAEAREYLGPGVAGIELVEGDYTVALPKGPYDLVYFGNVYHVYDADTNARVTRDAFTVISPGGTIAIQGYLRGTGPEAAMFAVNMLRSTREGEIWSEPEYTEWLADAGFREIEVQRIETARAHLILARRPG